MGGTKQIYLDFSDSGTDQNVGTINHTFTSGTWTHLAVAYTASTGSAVVYVNGAAIGTVTGLGTSLSDQPNQFFIGGSEDAGSGTRTFDGLIDDVRIWNVARTAGQISSNYQSEVSCSSPGLQGYWRFPNDLADCTTNANNLTNHGSATFSSDVPF